MSSPGKGGPVVDFANVSLIRGQRLILDRMNWRVEPGQHWAIVGANGSGKTSMLQVATGYLWASRGRVRILGRRLGSVELRALRRRIGWLSSSLAPMIRTDQPALSIVLSGAFASTGLYDCPSQPQVLQAREILRSVGCEHVAEAPYGTLSLGEQQRTLLARALMGRPELLIFDEPCAGLDVGGREAFLARLEQAGRQDGPSLVLVTHHIEEIVPVFTHVLALKDGRAVAAGPKADVLTGRILSDTFNLRIDVQVAHGRYWPRFRGTP